MKDQLMKYVDTLFADISDNQYAHDLHDEIAADLSSVYDDCINTGMSEAGAYAESIRSLGDVDLLLEDVRQKKITVRPDGGFQLEHFEKYRKAGGYDSGSAFEKLFSYVTPENDKVIFGTVNAVMWIVITILYFFFSILTDWWHITWLIFLVGAALTIGLDLLFALNRYRREPYSERGERKMTARMTGAFSGILWLGTTTSYFIFSFFFGGWAYSWLIFLFAAILQVLMNGFVKLIRGK